MENSAEKIEQEINMSKELNSSSMNIMKSAGKKKKRQD